MSKHYYRVCPDCGCNLDPGERCDCKTESYPEPGSSSFDRTIPSDLECKPLDGGGFLEKHPSLKYEFPMKTDESLFQMYPPLFTPFQERSGILIEPKISPIDEQIRTMMVQQELYEHLCKKPDVLVIGYDISEGQDLACLTVARKNQDSLTILNTFVGVEAIKMYENLMQGPCVRNDPGSSSFLKKEFHIPTNN